MVHGTAARAGMALVCIVCTAQGGWKDDIGLTNLGLRLGVDLPTGAGVEVSHIEAPEQDGDYVADLLHGEFILPPKTIINVTGTSQGSSAHATTVGVYYYGNLTSPSSDVMMIDAYQANDWLMGGMLRAFSDHLPRSESRRVENHSWIGTYGSVANDLEVLWRVDGIVQRDGVVVVAGVNNGAATPIPKLLSSAYNIIAVGKTNGGSSYGPTLISTPGRCKPDIVAPLSATSWATPVVAAAASMLIETADGMGTIDTGVGQEPGTLSERAAVAMLVKAVLMAGATKSEFTDWRKGFATPCTDGTVPLDYRYGAGELNVDNSHRILTAGQHEAGSTQDVPLSGWDYAVGGSGFGRRTFFEVEAGQTMRLSAVVTWLRKSFPPEDIDGDADVDEDDLALLENCWTAPRVISADHNCVAADLDGDGDIEQSDFGLFQARFSGQDKWAKDADGSATANIDLRLYEAIGFYPLTVLDKSISAVDNVEHIYIEELPAGRYMLEVTTNRRWEYALAWDLQPTGGTAASTESATLAGRNEPAQQDTAGSEVNDVPVAIPQLHITPAP